MVRVLIVGAGVTGSLCARMLRKHLPTQSQCQILVWEKSRGAGGRMSLSRHPDMQNCFVELGAQYISRNLKYLEQHASIYEDLLDCGIFKPLTGTIEGFRGEKLENFVCEKGLNSISKHFLANALTELCSSTRLEFLRLTSEENKSDWNVWEAATTKGNHDHFDIVLLTMPIPQILDIDGLKNHLTQSQTEDLESAKYSSRFAVGLFYEPGTFTLELPFVAKYVTDSEIIRYIAIDNLKRGASSNRVSVVAHSSVPFGLEHLEENTETVGSMMLQELKRLIPGLPNPSYVKNHKWRYSQVTVPAKTYGCMVAKTNPLLIFAGDGFTHSNMDGCLRSAFEVEKEIVKWLGNRSPSL